MRSQLKKHALASIDILGSYHPRKPRGYLLGQCDILGRKFTLRAEEPLGTSLTEPVPEVVEFHSADWAEKYFSAQSVRSSSRVSLSPSYTKQFSSLIDVVAWVCAL